MLKKVARANLARQIREQALFSADDHVLVAVSGGYDSLHLLHWLTDNALPADLQPTVSAGYVNHQMRSDAPLEEALVLGEFDRLGDKLATANHRQLTWATSPTTAIEEQAREKRYAMLIDMAQEVGANKIVTAHHAGDQAETILYKLVRGSRLPQLMGMAASRQLPHNIELVRPFLSTEKRALPDLVSTPITEWIEDSTNLDTRLARNQLRRVALPALREVNAQVDQHLRDSAEQLGALLKLAQGSLNVHVKAMAEQRTDWQQSDDVLLLVMQTWLAQRHLPNVKDTQLRQAIQLMRNPNTNRGVIALEDGWQLVRYDKQLLLERASTTK
jgi:tRNA(Ile)-lysidine synthetase-like protein